MKTIPGSFFRRPSASVALGIAAALAFLSGCAGPQRQHGDEAISVPSPNHDARRPNYVILHQTSSDSADRALRTLTSLERKVSAHYLIDRDGRLYQLVDESRRAWHAGVSYWGGLTDLNSASIGIELDNNGEEPFADVQIERLLQLLRDVLARHSIPATNVLGHGDVAPGRKVDPSRFFPWETLARQGYGLWCNPGDPRSEAMDPQLALQVIGYDIAQPDAARAAFRRHYFGVESETDFVANEREWLGCLVAKRQSRPSGKDSIPSY